MYAKINQPIRLFLYTRYFWNVLAITFKWSLFINFTLCPCRETWQKREKKQFKRKCFQIITIFHRKGIICSMPIVYFSE